jgi:hypothetical protein
MKRYRRWQTVTIYVGFAIALSVATAATQIVLWGLLGAGALILAIVIGVQTIRVEDVGPLAIESRPPQTVIAIERGCSVKFARAVVLGPRNLALNSFIIRDARGQSIAVPRFGFTATDRSALFSVLLRWISAGQLAADEETRSQIEALGLRSTTGSSS